MDCGRWKSRKAGARGVSLRPTHLKLLTLDFLRRDLTLEKEKNIRDEVCLRKCNLLQPVPKLPQSVPYRLMKIIIRIRRLAGRLSRHIQLTLLIFSPL
jgi:hypothetical protein